MLEMCNPSIQLGAFHACHVEQQKINGQMAIGHGC